jgi:UDP-N-acetylmuramate: L-alanyl-gamma-D-glutamyl-meso-diaminopimelate ligase
VLVRRVAARSLPGDVILLMSNGSFGGFIPSLLAALEAKGDPAT